MNKEITTKIIEDKKIFNHFMEQSYFIKQLNRDSNYYKNFLNELKIIYKERVSDKINNAIDGVEMVSSIIDTL